MRVRLTRALAVVLLLCSPALARAQASSAALLQAALYEQEITGDLKAAVAIYQRIIAEHANDRPVAARALVEVALAYETLGAGDAVPLYRRVLAQYPEQQGPARLAAARLSVLVEAAPPVTREESGLSFRRAWSTEAPIELGRMSPDGRYASFVDWGGRAAILRGHADIALYDVRDGSSRLVTDRPSLSLVDVYPSAPSWSGDGQWIAYSLWAVDWTHRELHIVRPDGTGDRKLLDNRQMSDVRAMAFASNNEFVVALLRGWDEVYRIGVVSLRDGSLVVLKTMGRHPPESMSLSPDDRFVAYEYPAPNGADQHDVFVLALDGTAEVRVASHAADDSAPVWTPDGERIAFMSDRSGQPGLWAVRWQDGRVLGEPELVHGHLGPMRLLGLMASGAPYFSVEKMESEVYLARLDLTGQGSLTEVARVPETHLLTNLRPSWSLDGERLAYLSNRGSAGDAMHLVVKTLATGEERAHPLPFRGGDLRARRADWSLDGRHLWVEGSDPEGVIPGRVSYRVDATTGEVTREAHRRDFAGMTASGVTEFGFVDGRQDQTLRSLGIRIVGQTDLALFQQGDEPLRPDETLLFVRNGVQRVVSGDWNSLEPLTPLGHMGQWRLSPDGGTLALAVAGDTIMDSNLLYVLPLSGGAAREVLRLERGGSAPGSIRTVQWTADGEHVIYAVVASGKTDDDAEIWIVDTRGGTPRRLDLPLTPYQLGNLRFHPGGDRIAYTMIKPIKEIWVGEGFPWQKPGSR